MCKEKIILVVQSLWNGGDSVLCLISLSRGVKHFSLGSGWKGSQEQRLCICVGLWGVSAGSGRWRGPSCLLWVGHLSYISQQTSILLSWKAVCPSSSRGHLPFIPWTSDCPPSPLGAVTHKWEVVCRGQGLAVASRTKDNLESGWLLWRKSFRIRA